jgi:type VI secretion system protein
VPVRERTLLGRLRDPETDAVRRAGEDLGAVEESVGEHLRQMLNTRQGCCRTVPDYGIPDLTEIVRDSPESMDAIQKAIRRSIEQYEPRLTNVRVKFTPSEDDVLKLSFEITARIVVGSKKADVRFATRIDATGRVDVVR